jgi:hypothetical protein
MEAVSDGPSPTDGQQAWSPVILNEDSQPEGRAGLADEWFQKPCQGQHRAYHSRLLTAYRCFSVLWCHELEDFHLNGIFVFLQCIFSRFYSK